MGLNRAQKEQEVAELRQRFEQDEIVVVTHYSGLTVKQVTDLRSKMRKEGASFKVAKNTLVKRALEGTKFAGLAGLFTGPTGIASSKDPMAAARVAYSFAKDNEKLVILGGANSQEVLSLETIKFLATLPSLDALRGKLVGLIQAPATKIAQLSTAPAAKLARVFGAYAKTGEAA